LTDPSAILVSHASSPDGRTREIVIRVRADAEPADALIPLSAGGLKPYSLELKPIVRLADDGKLKTVTIGRKRFTTLRHLLALVDAAPVVQVDAPADDIAAAARKRAARRASK
jgi:hypothetical protein